MADVTYTSTAVVLTSGPAPISVQVGATVTAGQPLYFDASTQRWLPATANTAAGAAASAVALSGASTGQYTMAALPGSVITYGSGLTKGVVLFVSGAAAGGLAPFADLVAGKYISVVGVPTSTTALIFNPIVSGVTV